MTARLIIGDSLEVTRKMPDASVDLVVTSPPFLALRSYLPADHPDKALEMGSEATPGAFLDALLDLTEEWARVLAPHGSICVELGDTYSGSGGGGGDYLPGGLREDQPGFGGSAEKQREGNAAHWRQKNARADEWPEAKSLCLIPELYRFALAYGFNPLTERRTPTWRVRNVVRWHRPNPPVGALGDKFRPATSDMVVACKSRTRYFDLDAVRHAPLNGADPAKYTGNGYTKGNPSGDGEDAAMAGNPAGAPPLDTWIIPTAPFKGSHYATFPPDLVVKPIKAMCPERVCRVCGEPSRRTYADNPDYAGRGGTGLDVHNNDEQGASLKGFHHVAYPPPAQLPDGWTDCGHDDYRPGVVLDPFAGSGTTLAVATGHGRDAIGVDLDERNAELCRQRIGMFLEVS